MASDVGERLKAIREQQGLSQRELAKRTGVTHATVSLIEQNKVSPSISSLKKILGGLSMSVGDSNAPITVDGPAPLAIATSSMIAAPTPPEP